MMNILLEFNFDKLESGLYKVSMKRSINGTEYNSNSLEEHQLTFAGLCQIIEESRTDSIMIKGKKSSALLKIHSFLKAQFPHLEVEIKYQQDNEIKVTDKAFFNGFNLLVSGLYPSNLYHVGTKHLVGGGQAQEDYSESDMIHQSINSSFVSDRVGDGDNHVYYLKKFLFKEVDSDDEQRMKQYSLTLTNSEAKEKNVHAVNYINRSVLRISENNEQVMYVVYFDSKEDIAAYNKFVENVNITGALPATECFYLIKDECMWAPGTFCSLRNDIRRKLPGDTSFISQHSCYNYAEENRALGDNKECIIFHDDHEKKRLFEKVKENNYFLDTYTKIRNILRSFVLKMDNHELEELILFNTPKKTYLSNIALSEHSYMERNYFIFHFKNEIYLYSKKLHKFYKISNEIAVILEVFMYTNNKHEAEAMINRNFPISHTKLITIIKKLKEFYGLII